MKDPLDFFDGNRDVDPCLDHGAVKEDVCINERFIDVLEELPFGFTAVLARELPDA